MRLDLLLVERGLCTTRQEAQEVIHKGDVLVNGIAQTKQSKNISDQATVEVLSTRKYVSRGGEKLAGAFAAVFKHEDDVRAFLKSKKALDVGASTGGFTDFLLQYGISSVTAVDVGSGQLHESIKSNNKVTSFEKTDIRDYSSSTKYDVVVADLSFIPLRTVFDSILCFGAPGCYFFLLIKPQFEVGKGNTKKGIVKDDGLTLEVLNEYKKLLLKRGVENLQIRPCVIAGGDGNQEYFAIFSL